MFLIVVKKVPVKILQLGALIVKNVSAVMTKSTHMLAQIQVGASRQKMNTRTNTMRKINLYMRNAAQLLHGMTASGHLTNVLIENSVVTLLMIISAMAALTKEEKYKFVNLHCIFLLIMKGP